MTVPYSAKSAITLPLLVSLAQTPSGNGQRSGGASEARAGRADHREQHSPTTEMAVAPRLLVMGLGVGNNCAA